MKIVIVAAFDGYPNGEDKEAVHFAAGETVDVPDELAQNAIGKKLAHAATAAAKTKPEQQVTHEAE